jgi:3-dehydroquinate dehydratase/shikimate dehydrogenase
MICVTLGRGRHSSLAEEWKAAAEAGAELVELRIDCLRREPDMKRILKERPTPLVFTLRRGVDGGLWRGNEEKRQQLLREAIVMGVDYVDLESDVAAQIRRFGKTKRIVSYHNFQETPDDLGAIIEQCSELDPDVVKVATSAHSVADAARVLKLGAKAKGPTTAIAMGELGFFTRILGRKYGAPLTYAGFHPERTFAPGMPRFQNLSSDYFYDRINVETDVYAVIGAPIEQSLSPPIHNASFRQLGLNKVMVPFLIPPDSLVASLKELRFLGIKGMSVTIPHKETIIPLLTDKDESVERTGACNTVIFHEGKASGTNTDYQAAIDALEHALGGRASGASSSPLLDKQALVLGAGGAARSIAFGLSRSGASVTLTNRHDERATALAEAVSCRTVSWPMRASTIADIIVNCTPVGMHPDVDDTPLPPAAFGRSEMIVFDTVYHPENTMMLKLAAERGCTVVTGVEMFVRQAAAQFRLYTGREAPMERMRDVIKRRLGPFPE